VSHGVQFVRKHACMVQLQRGHLSLSLVQISGLVNELANHRARPVGGRPSARSIGRSKAPRCPSRRQGRDHRQPQSHVPFSSIHDPWVESKSISCPPARHLHHLGCRPAGRSHRNRMLGPAVVVGVSAFFPLSGRSGELALSGAARRGVRPGRHGRWLHVWIEMLVVPGRCCLGSLFLCSPPWHEVKLMHAPEAGRH
jgi:hypothetical protein